MKVLNTLTFSFSFLSPPKLSSFLGKDEKVSDMTFTDGVIYLQDVPVCVGKGQIDVIVKKNEKNFEYNFVFELEN